MKKMILLIIMTFSNGYSQTVNYHKTYEINIPYSYQIDHYIDGVDFFDHYMIDKHSMITISRNTLSRIIPDFDEFANDTIVIKNTLKSLGIERIDNKVNKIKSNAFVYRVVRVLEDNRRLEGKMCFYLEDYFMYVLTIFSAEVANVDVDGIIYSFEVKK